MKLLFFASFRERLQSEGETWADITGANTAGEVLELLRLRGEPWQSVLDDEHVLVAVNQEVAQLDTPVGVNDEVAFFPPVTGG